ncbi:MAG: methionyl-tRNA formyltransferase [Propionibacteriaceae bacterium]|jgi:methionyl-tRNA formyltransferase|nr:methionyl-tRNA formyltransferase [Propionibacteriaceae bacterium]
MRLIFAGTPQVAADTLSDLLQRGTHSVVGVLTRQDAPAGRGKRLRPSPVAELAAANGLPLLKSGTAKSPQVGEWVRSLAPDCAVVVAYGGLIPAALLDVPAHGWVNVHYSLLPRWRGAAPVQRAIMAGDSVTGVTVQRVVEELDAGPWLRQVEVPLGEETAGEMLAKLAPVGAEALANALDDIAAGRAVSTEQPPALVTLAPKITAETARLSWDRPAAELARLVRACNPSPMAWTLLDGERFRVLAARAGQSSGLAAGRFGFGKREVRVGTGDGDLELVQVQAAGKKAMAAADWARGLRRGELAAQ